MPAPQLQHFTVGGAAAASGEPRRLAYWDWPCEQAEASGVVLCVHGLSRQGRDFDTLARALCERSRVIAVDVAGRGHSDWLADPMGYQIPTYAADLAALVTHLRAETPDVPIDWVGTSMGGLIGMALAAQPQMALRRLVLNDVGPVIQWEALQRIGSYLGQNPSFDSEQAAVAYLASISTGFGPHTPEQWRDLSLPLLRERDGRWWLHYDPAIATPFKAMTANADAATAQQIVQAGEAALWGLFDAIRVPTLLLRGAQSDLLSAETATLMTQRGPQAQLVTFDGVGHAPTLVAAEQVAAVRGFLWAK
ncbi:alpha/beta fold hydrolase [Hydrogenophaga sp.]|uniref:alpha/beta fold hydrolase n=1 Tax=Hydrogenophaga sp. TaxID=1904254 RepID=UPI0027284213|nr:alpha/beta hydrolase [Hydrogenophaga sp.]MDO9507274.1 alpha/beta hydrolase [Hydrogenophaga sp.]MDP2988909.1 alpha/beta hydrolase [Hydrogenophaga sp.]MDP3628806.1 alpha/beta hydrolase [Hydrogenophaga sp.]